MSYWVMIHPRKEHLAFRLHHGSSDAFDHLPVYILNAETDCFGPAKPIRRRLEFYSLAWIKAGNCRYWNEVLGKTVPVPVGNVIAVGPDLLHAYGGDGEACLEDYVVFFGPVAEAFGKLGLFSPEHPFVALQAPERIAEMAALFAKGTIEAQLRAGLALQNMLLDLMTQAPNTAGGREVPAIRSLCRRIESQPGLHLSCAEMAAACALSESHFRKLFRQSVGMPPARYFERMRMHQACQALGKTDLRISEIANRLGYDDPLYFSHRFREAIGISPRRYRQSVRSGRCRDILA